MLSNLSIRSKAILAIAGCFLAGTLTWYLTSAKHHHMVKRNITQSMNELEPGESLVTIDETKITVGDLEWEFNMVIERNLNSSDLIQPENFSDSKPDLNGLRQELFANLVERKVLYTFMKTTPIYARNHRKWEKQCNQEFDESKVSLRGVVQSEEDERKLRERACELRSIAEYVQIDTEKNEVTDTMIQRYYKNNPDLFTYPQRVTIRQIVLADEKTAKKVRAQARSYNFAKLAKEHSITPEGAEKGGLIGPFSKNELPAVFNAAFQLRVGQISGIQKSAYGFHIMSLIKKESKGLRKLAEVRGEITAKLKKRRMSKYYGKLLESALAAVKVKSPLQIW
jgi:hypothetical protein